MIYLQMLLVAVITIYIVDLSGFTQAWRGLLSSRLHIKSLKPLPPFDCGQCMVWWCCLICAAVLHNFNLCTIAFSGLLSMLSIPIGQFLIFIREAAIMLTNKLIDLCSHKN